MTPLSSDFGCSDVLAKVRVVQVQRQQLLMSIETIQAGHDLG
jgi:hypothetical protein